MSNYRKSIAAAVGAVITILSAAGLIDVVSPEVQAAIVTLLTVAAVYLVPNQNKPSNDFTAFYFDAADKNKVDPAAYREFAQKIQGESSD